MLALGRHERSQGRRQPKLLTQGVKAVRTNPTKISPDPAERAESDRRSARQRRQAAEHGKLASWYVKEGLKRLVHLRKQRAGKD